LEPAPWISHGVFVRKFACKDISHNKVDIDGCNRPFSCKTAGKFRMAVIKKPWAF
jgi:hypothetical protein